MGANVLRLPQTHHDLSGRSAEGASPPDYLRPSQTPDSCLGPRGRRFKSGHPGQFPQVRVVLSMTGSIVLASGLLPSNADTISGEPRGVSETVLPRLAVWAVWSFKAMFRPRLTSQPEALAHPDCFLTQPEKCVVRHFAV